MKNLEFDLNRDFLKAGDLQVGCLYLVKDGRLVIYLGKDTLDRFIFYNIANCLYMRGYRNMTLAHYDAQVQYLVAMARAVLSRKVDVAMLGVYRSIPKLCCEFPYIAFSLVCADWYNKSMVGMKGFPVLASPSRPANSGFVSSKDLIPGRCYYTGSCWRSTFCYLGRTKTGDYRWYFIGNENVFMHSSVAELFARSEVTKSNKKVKPLEMALSDPDACVYEDTERLIKSGYRLNPEEVLAFARRLN